MIMKVVCNCILKIGLVNLVIDFELLLLILESGFRIIKLKNNFVDFDFFFGSNWDVKKKLDDYFFYVIYVEFVFDVFIRVLIMKIKFVEFICVFCLDSYCVDIVVDCC